MKHFSIIFVLVVLFALALNSIAQIDWTKYPGNPVLEPGDLGEWDQNFVLAPSVLFKDSTYHLWYCTRLATPGLIGYATSLDGISWTKYDDPATPSPPYAHSDPVIVSGSSGEWDYAILQPSVLWNDADSLFHIWYIAGSANGTYLRIGYATSPNGTTWTKYNDTTTTNPPFAESDPVLFPGDPGSWDASWVGNPCVKLIGNEYHMWYVAYSGTGDITRIGHATSGDGIKWAKDTLNNPVLSPTSIWEFPELRNPSILFLESDSMYHMWYSGGPFFGWKVGHATSPHPDSSWMEYLGNPVLELGEPGEWDDVSASWCSVIYKHPDSLKMWYTGMHGQNGRIGYATAPVPEGIKDNIPAGIPKDYLLSQNYPNPFNPTTNIEFSIPKADFVTLTVYNILGEEVATLVSERLTAGKYKYKWSRPSGLPSGVYLYKIEMSSFKSMKKMILIK
jgi:hypothetical protein